jgi:hypothetical protein
MKTKYEKENSVSAAMDGSEEYSLNAVLKEPSSKKTVLAKVVTRNGTIDINIKGYDFNNNNGIITLELLEGQLRLLVWADKNSEEPTHIINLEGAKEKSK